MNRSDLIYKLIVIIFLFAFLLIFLFLITDVVEEEQPEYMQINSSATGRSLIPRNGLVYANGNPGEPGTIWIRQDSTYNNPLIFYNVFFEVFMSIGNENLTVSVNNESNFELSPIGSDGFKLSSPPTTGYLTVRNDICVFEPLNADDSQVFESVTL